VSIFKSVFAEIFKEIFHLSLAPEQLQWQAQELGVLIHFNLETFGSVGEESLNIPSPSIFDPYLLNTDNWVQTMVDFGAQDAVLVAKVRSTITVTIELNNKI
jgi:alpha-L-fucosidase